jgi:hypothetical protein
VKGKVGLKVFQLQELRLKKYSNMEAPDSGKIISAVYIVGFIIALVVIYKILAAIGIVKSGAKKREEKKEAEAATALRELPYFDPLFLKGDTTYVPFGKGSQVAAALRNAMSGLGTDEEKIFTTFAKLPSKKTISEVALWYGADYKRTLIVDLLNELNDAEKVTLADIISKLN